MKKYDWVQILLNLWGAIAVLMMMAVMLVLSFEKPLPITFVPSFIFMGIIVAGVLCGINFIKLLTDNPYSASETIETSDTQSNKDNDPSQGDK